MIRYYKLFDLLNRRGMKKSDLRVILSPKTIAKLSKGENIETNVIDKICLYLDCQPSDIMEVVKVVEDIKETINLVSKSSVLEPSPNADTIEEQFIETRPLNLDIAESDEELATERNYLPSEDTI